jgi:hypothetical protein
MRTVVVVGVMLSTACNSYEQLCRVVCNAPARCSTLGGFLPACGDACAASASELDHAGCESDGHDVVSCLNSKDLCHPSPTYCSAEVDKVTSCIAPYCASNPTAQICDPGSQCVALHGGLGELCP